MTLTDDYAWLRDKQNPEVTAYLEAENAYAEAVMAPLAGLRDELYREMLSHMKQTDVSVPYPRRRLVVLHAHRGRQPVRHPLPQAGLRAPARHADAPEEVILDGNQLAEGHAFFSIGATEHHRRRPLARLHYRHHRLSPVHAPRQGPRYRRPLPGKVERVGSVVWAADNSALFYTVEDEEQKRQFQLWRTFGQQLSGAVLVYQDDDERFNLGVGRTRDGRFLVVESASHTTTESRVLAADRPDDSFTLICPREDDHEYSVDHRHGLWYHPHQRSRPKLPPRHRARIHARPRALDRAHSSSRKCDA